MIAILLKIYFNIKTQVLVKSEILHQLMLQHAFGTCHKIPLKYILKLSFMLIMGLYFDKSPNTKLEDLN